MYVVASSLTSVNLVIGYVFTMSTFTVFVRQGHAGVGEI